MNPLSALIEMPGPVFIHMVILVVLAAALSLEMFTERISAVKRQPRLVTTLWVLASFQFALLCLSLAGLLSWPLFETYASVAEPGILVLSVLWLAWVWCFPEPSPTADRLLGLLSGVVVVLIVVELFLTAQGLLEPAIKAIGWASVGLAISLAGLVRLILGRDPLWAAGATSLSLFFVFFAIYGLAERLASQGMAIILLAQLLTFPSTFWLPLRAKSQDSAYKGDRMPNSLWESWLKALPELMNGSAASFPQRLLQAITEMCNASVGVWVSFPPEQAEPVLISYHPGSDRSRGGTTAVDPSVLPRLDQLLSDPQPVHLRGDEVTAWMDHISGDGHTYPADFLPSPRYSGDRSAILLRHSSIRAGNLLDFWRVILQTSTIASCWKISAKMKSEEGQVRFIKGEQGHEGPAIRTKVRANRHEQPTNAERFCALESLAESIIARARETIIRKDIAIALNVPPEGSVQADCEILEDLLSTALQYVCTVCRPEATVLLDLASLEDEDRKCWLFFQARASYESPIPGEQDIENASHTDATFQLGRARSLAKQLGGAVWTEGIASARASIQIFLPVMSGENFS